MEYPAAAVLGEDMNEAVKEDFHHRRTVFGQEIK
jgi:hypothetical protein